MKNQTLILLSIILISYSCKPDTTVKEAATNTPNMTESIDLEKSAAAEDEFMQFIIDSENEAMIAIESMTKTEGAAPIKARAACNRLCPSKRPTNSPPGPCRAKDTKSFRICGLVSLFPSGKLIGNLAVSSNRAQGFTGCVLYKFYDSTGEVFYEHTTPGYGVNGYSNRKVKVNTKVDKEIAQLTKKIEAVPFHCKSGRSDPIQVIKKELKKIKI